MSAPLLRMQGLARSFGGNRALDGVDLELHAGEVHALIGENGAGKSTLMKVLSGAIRPHAGRMFLDGEDYAPRSPQEALGRGVAMIYQELNLAPQLRVEDHFQLGRERVRAGLLQRRALREEVHALLVELGRGEVDPRLPVHRLGPGTRQVVEIARALHQDARILVMDEPTSSLSATDAERLFGTIQRLREAGVAVVYISHFLEEVQRVAQRYTVLRDGRSVARGEVAEVRIPQLIEHMVGRRVDELFPVVPHTPGELLLELEGFGGDPLPREAGLRLARGEILGVAGLVGAGRSELLRAIFGLEAVRRGELRIAGVSSTRASPADRLRQGLGLLSEDRKGEGLALGRSIAENLSLSRLGPFLRWGWLDRRRRREAVEGWARRLGIRCRSADQAVGELSGGNQQKVALARLLHHDVDVLLLDEPTRGVDVGSKSEIYRLIGELAARGKAVLFVSSSIPELMGVCDRIAVMHRGILGTARPVGQWTETAILAEATQGEAAA